MKELSFKLQQYREYSDFIQSCFLDKYYKLTDEDHEELKEHFANLEELAQECINLGCDPREKYGYEVLPHGREPNQDSEEDW